MLTAHRRNSQVELLSAPHAGDDSLKARPKQATAAASSVPASPPPLGKILSTFRRDPLRHLVCSGWADAFQSVIPEHGHRINKERNVFRRGRLVIFLNPIKLTQPMAGGVIGGRRTPAYHDGLRLLEVTENMSFIKAIPTPAQELCPAGSHRHISVKNLNPVTFWENWQGKTRSAGFVWLVFNVGAKHGPERPHHECVHPFLHAHSPRWHWNVQQESQ